MVPNQSDSWPDYDLGRKLSISTLRDSGGNPPQKPLGSNSRRYGFDRTKLGLRNLCKSDSDSISYFTVRFQIFLACLTINAMFIIMNNESHNYN